MGNRLDERAQQCVGSQITYSFLASEKKGDNTSIAHKDEKSEAGITTAVRARFKWTSHPSFSFLIFEEKRKIVKKHRLLHHRNLSLPLKPEIKEIISRV